METLVYHNGALGDFVLFLPALRALRAATPGDWLCLMTRPAFAEMASALELVDEVLVPVEVAKVRTRLFGRVHVAKVGSRWRCSILNSLGRELCANERREG